jgi:hypothetical protein
VNYSQHTYIPESGMTVGEARMERGWPRREAQERKKERHQEEYFRYHKKYLIYNNKIIYLNNESGIFQNSNFKVVIFIISYFGMAFNQFSHCNYPFSLSLICCCTYIFQFVHKYISFINFSQMHT